MMEACAKCSGQLDEEWTFCAHCGAKVDGPTAEIAPAGHEHEAAPVTGAFSGAMLGLIVTPIAIVFGVLLCLTGLGMVVGIPVIILGILAPLAAPLIGMGAAKGKVL